MVQLALGTLGSLLLISDGARWIRRFFTEMLGQLPQKMMILDWQHLFQKCQEVASRICRGRDTKRYLLRRWYRRLWRGNVEGAIELLQALRPQARNADMLDTFIAYLAARAPWIPNYRQRRIEQRYIGSGHVEQANDLIVARRQKGRGMHWSQATSDALAALRTLMLNQGWERYWQHRELLPLVVS